LGTLERARIALRLRLLYMPGETRRDTSCRRMSCPGSADHSCAALNQLLDGGRLSSLVLFHWNKFILCAAEKEQCGPRR
jgi:hypothetical protein